jgi:type I restriction enzyme R subunit
VELILKELAPLMKYYEEVPGKLIEVNKPDVILRITRFNLKIKEDPKMIEFLGKNPIVKKIKDGKGITCLELHELVKDLEKLNPLYTIENIQKNLKKDFLIFLFEMIGRTYEYDPKELIEREFDRHIINVIDYNSKQIEFLLLLKKIFIIRKYIELKDFAQDPFKSENPVELFKGRDELKKIVEQCQKIKVI